jgi:large subunit ribosomal protein L3
MRKGSMEFWPHRRAKKQMPRVRNWPKLAEPSFSGIVGFKVGMTHVALIDDSESPSKGSEIVKPVTILEIPRVYVYGLRLYSKKNYTEPTKELYAKELAAKVGIKKTENTVDKIESLKQQLNNYDNVTALAFLDASNLGFGNKRMMRFELQVGGNAIADKFAFIEKWLGKEVRIKDLLTDGEYVDVKSISKGKGWSGVIKRFKTARLSHKATQKIRHVGTLGAWHPPKVLFTVPHAGHMGYNFRTELNKRVLKIGDSNQTGSINVKGGFLNYGVVKNDFIVLEGSIPGPAKRLVRIRKAVRSRRAVKAPELTFISLSSKQGA